jgi:hypothetical protein
MAGEWWVNRCEGCGVWGQDVVVAHLHGQLAEVGCYHRDSEIRRRDYTSEA